jgi:SPP1 family predicted phage head-tail adaptor
MNAGAYSDLVTIQKKTEKRDKDGFSKETWEDYYTNYAYVNKLSGSEFWQAAETAAQSTIRFEMRYHTQLERVDTKNYRLLFRDRIFNITNIDNVMFKNETVKISGIEVV